MLKEKKGAEKRRAEAAQARKLARKPPVLEAEVPPELEPEVPNSRAAKKREERLKKREERLKKQDEVAARRAENSRIAQLEQEKIEKDLLMKMLGRKTVTKVLKRELESRREQEQESMRRKIEEKNSRITAEVEYKRMIHVENTNLNEGRREEEESEAVPVIIDARTIDEAIKQLSGANLSMKVPKLKAQFKAFEEAQLPKLKEEKPGLCDYQYKDMILKMWKRSGSMGTKVSAATATVQKKREERKCRRKSPLWDLEPY